MLASADLIQLRAATEVGFCKVNRIVERSKRHFLARRGRSAHHELAMRPMEPLIGSATLKQAIADCMADRPGGMKCMGASVALVTRTVFRPASLSLPLPLADIANDERRSWIGSSSICCISSSALQVSFDRSWTMAWPTRFPRPARPIIWRISKTGSRPSAGNVTSRIATWLAGRLTPIPTRNMAEYVRENFPSQRRRCSRCARSPCACICLFRYDAGLDDRSTKIHEPYDLLNWISSPRLASSRIR